MARTQSYRPFAVGTALGDDVLLLKTLRGAETLGRPFQYELELLSESQSIDFNAIVGTNATVRLPVGDDAVRYINGYVIGFEMVRPLKRVTEYRAVLAPWLWFLTRTADCRIYQNKSVVDIFKDVFQRNGFQDLDVRLSGSYTPREYCVQYRQTDFQFVSRLMEEEGIYYFFEHKDGGHVLVLADAAGAHAPYSGYETVIFHPQSEEEGPLDREHVWDFSRHAQVEPGGYAHTDFDFESPRKSLLSVANANWPHPGELPGVRLPRRLRPDQRKRALRTHPHGGAGRPARGSAGQG